MNTELFSAEEIVPSRGRRLFTLTHNIARTNETLIRRLGRKCIRRTRTREAGMKLRRLLFDLSSHLIAYPGDIPSVSLVLGPTIGSSFVPIWVQGKLLPN